MGTGYEDYVLYMYSNNALALARCGQHLIGLMAQQGVRTGADWVTYDPSTLEATIAQVRKDWNYLNGVVYNIGAPRAIPTRRLDPGPNVGLSNSGSNTGSNSSG